MKLTQANYYSPEANQAYWSASFVKAMLSCEAAAMAELRGEYKRPESTALMVGAYVDAWFEGPKSFEAFMETHPELFTKSGTLKADYVRADAMIRKASDDPVFMEFTRGQKQKILTGRIEGLPFKAKLDFYVKGRRIVDLKTVKDMRPVYLPEQGKVSFADAWNWPLQMAIYQALEGNGLPCYLAVITKEDPPDIEVVHIPQAVLDAELKILRGKLARMEAVREGVIEPERCGHCAYCRATKKLAGAVDITEFMEEST